MYVKHWRALIRETTKSAAKKLSFYLNKHTRRGLDLDLEKLIYIWF